MTGFLVFLLLLAAASAAIFWFGPQAVDTVKLKRQNARIVNITKRTKRDMDDLARKQRRDSW